MSLQAIVFDFDGVIANSEPLHLKAFQQVLADEGILLTSQRYYSHYLGYDDVGVFGAIGADLDVPMSPERVANLVRRKGEALEAMIHSGAVLFPGAADFIRAAAAAVPIAIASGALRHEIDEIVSAAGLADLFVTVVASGDTPQSKPAPDPYRLAFDRLQQASGGRLEPWRCVAIEDSRWGLESAHGAGLRCVGVTTSYPASELGNAELVVDGLHALRLEALHQLCSAERT